MRKWSFGIATFGATAGLITALMAGCGEGKTASLESIEGTWSPKSFKVRLEDGREISPEVSSDSMLMRIRNGVMLAFDTELGAFKTVAQVSTAGSGYSVRPKEVTGVQEWQDVRMSLELKGDALVMKVRSRIIAEKVPEGVEPGPSSTSRIVFERLSERQARIRVDGLTAASQAQGAARARILERIAGTWELVELRLEYYTITAEQMADEQEYTDANGQKVVEQSPKRVVISADGTVDVNSGKVVGPILFQARAGKPGELEVSFPVGSGNSRTMGLPALQEDGTLTFVSEFAPGETMVYRRAE